jgi:phospholipase/carboxylesterase
VEIAGLTTTAIGPADAPLTVVLLHGYSMGPADLAPFAHSIGVPALFLFPRGPLVSPLRGHSWWDVEVEERSLAMSRGPRDLAEQHPPGLAAAREQLASFLDAVTRRFTVSRLVVGGFSQGAMLATDCLLHGARGVDGLVLLSASRLAQREWRPLRERLRGLPVFVSHGRMDTDLAFGAGEALRDFMLAGGAQVMWVPFEGGHEIPLVTWRGLRKFLHTLLQSGAQSATYGRSK